jgi:hypothetical protein
MPEHWKGDPIEGEPCGQDLLRSRAEHVQDGTGRILEIGRGDVNYRINVQK